MAMRERDFEFSTMTSSDNIYMFKGSGNHLATSRVYNVEWICVYQLAWYPFDTQTCRMILEADGNSEEFVDLNVGTIEYSGPLDLTQYFVKSTSLIKTENGTLDIIVVLGRRLFGNAFEWQNQNLLFNSIIMSGNLMTIYLPTLLLVAICYSTNFYLPDLFSAQVAVNLTCMLVCTGKRIFLFIPFLATMFVSVSDNLPKTSYIKMVDIWLVTTLCIPFIEVIFTLK